MVASSLYTAQKIADLLSSFVDEKNILLFPNDDILRLGSISSSKELLSERLYTMGEILFKEKKILIVTVSSLLLPLPTVSLFKENVKYLKVGDNIDLTTFKSSLVKMGYENVNKIDQSLQFASRGSILDIFPINYSYPIRIEFFGNQVESIRHFDIASQESNFDEIEITILPANEFLFSEEEIKNIPTKLKQRGINNISDELEDIFLYKYSPKNLRYYLSRKDNVVSILDYFDYENVIFADYEKIENIEKEIKEDTEEFLNELIESGTLLYKSDVFLKLKDLKFDFSKCIKGYKYQGEVRKPLFKTRAVIKAHSNLSNLSEIIDTYLDSDSKLFLALSNKMQADTIVSLLEDRKVKYQAVEGLNLSNLKVSISLTPINQGFELVDEKIVCLTSYELFSYHRLSSRYLSHFKEGTIIKSYEELSSGDYVVHEHSGIGKFISIKTIETLGVKHDYLYIEYLNDEYLYIPLEQLRLIRKYAAKEGATPRLSSLRSNEWQKRKSRIKKKIGEMADKLYALYDERKKESGVAYPEDDEFQTLFEKEFPYELTPDQKTSVDEIKKDLESDKVMDRLLCGDVGFGKTEVAFRAAFKVLVSGKQVAILCPTIILARQHYIRAKERFASFGVKIAMLSRIIKASEQSRIFEGINKGEIHLVIATHKLLSSKLNFKDLGLLIIDEEQRFGVKQKEQIKMIKHNVEVLSLSATPIPRTLQLSLVGLRPLSTINTPPLNRIPIQTYVLPYKFNVVVDLIRREKNRLGQVFYVRNDINLLYVRQSQLAAKLPDINFGIIHGQMNKNEIEDTMSDFYDGKIDVLLATSIIENGIDIPNVNLLIVEDADYYGLSQLYQIKGRVGRGSRIAYAYFMYDGYKKLTKDAEKRLRAIQEFSELGSGYKIAQRDLLIRGAGDILGEEQAGFIEMIGMDLYLKLLNEVIEERKSGEKKEDATPSIAMSRLNAYVPTDYALDEDKIEIYQEIADANDLKTVEKIKKKVIDVYGPIPKEVNNLIKKRCIEITANQPPFAFLHDEIDYIELGLGKEFSSINSIGVELFNVLSSHLKNIKIFFTRKDLTIRLKKEEDWLAELEQIIDATKKLFSDFKNNSYSSH